MSSGSAIMSSWKELDEHRLVGPCSWQDWRERRIWRLLMGKFAGCMCSQRMGVNVSVGLMLCKIMLETHLDWFGNCSTWIWVWGIMNFIQSCSAVFRPDGQWLPQRTSKGPTVRCWAANGRNTLQKDLIIDKTEYKIELFERTVGTEKALVSLYIGL